jgi:antitoxin component YwqK of YwqJK toxin-antitoxin module
MATIKDLPYELLVKIAKEVETPLDYFNLLISSSIFYKHMTCEDKEEYRLKQIVPLEETNDRDMRVECFVYKHSNVRTGKYKKFFDGGKGEWRIAMETEYVNGVINGPIIKYFLGGKVRVRGQYVDGVKEGTWFWSPCGDLIGSFSIDYKNGKYHGEMKEYYREGVLHSLSLWNEGEIYGVEKYWSEGFLRKEVEHGEGGSLKCKQYDKDGVMIKEDTYQGIKERKRKDLGILNRKNIGRHWR